MDDELEGGLLDGLTAEQRRLLVDCVPRLDQLPDGTWRSELGGHVGMGRTKEEAVAEATEKVMSALTRPKL